MCIQHWLALPHESIILMCGANFFPWQDLVLVPWETPELSLHLKLLRYCCEGLWQCVREFVDGNLFGMPISKIEGMFQYSCIFMLYAPKFNLNVITLNLATLDNTCNPFFVCVNYVPFTFSVAVRASITGWLTLHRQTKLVAPSGFIRLITVILVFFSLHQLRQMLVHS